MDPLKITLAGTEYTVRPLTLRQARAVGIGVMKFNSDEAFTGSIDQAIGVLSAALSRDYPEMNEQKLLDSEIDFREARAAADQVLEFSGFVKPKDGAPGEGEAGSTGQP